MCHLVLLLPIGGLGAFWLLPMQLAAPLYSLVLAASALLYVKVFEAMSLPLRYGPETIKGARATVLLSKGRRGIVRLGPDLWTARCLNEEVLEEGREMVVLEREGTCLVVGGWRGAKDEVAQADRVE